MDDPIVNNGSRRGAWRSSIAVLCVLAMHLAFYLALRDSVSGRVRDMRRMPRPPTMTTLRLLPPAPSKLKSVPDAAPAVERKRPVPTAGRATVARILDTTAAHTAVPPLAAAVTSSPAPEPAASHPPRALDLTLRPGVSVQPGIRNPALDDPRSNAARQTPAQRMADRLNTQTVEERLDDGRTRVQRGADCQIVSQSRTSQLMRFSDGATRTPWLVGACP